MHTVFLPLFSVELSYCNGLTQPGKPMLPIDVIFFITKAAGHIKNQIKRAVNLA